MKTHEAIKHLLVISASLNAFSNYITPITVTHLTALVWFDRYEICSCYGCHKCYSLFCGQEMQETCLAVLRSFLRVAVDYTFCDCAFVGLTNAVRLCIEIIHSCLWKEFSIHRKSRQGLLGRMSTSFHNLAAVYMMRQRTQEFEQVREYVAALGEKLNSVDKISQHIHKERQGAYVILAHLTLFSVYFSLLGK
jgi:hypothetical protein